MPYRSLKVFDSTHDTFAKALVNDPSNMLGKIICSNLNLSLSYIYLLFYHLLYLTILSSFVSFCLLPTLFFHVKIVPLPLFFFHTFSAFPPLSHIPFPFLSLVNPTVIHLSTSLNGQRYRVAHKKVAQS